MNYYNDIDKRACATLRELMAAGLIPAGVVDERSILDVKPDELREYDQCHFFAGAGFWSLALQWAGLGNAAGIWSGSCPCQPWSCAGTARGFEDERHLWPAFRDLIVACRPAVVFGEQVASAAVVGKAGGRHGTTSAPVWLDGVYADMEGASYSFGAIDIPAAGVGAPNIRQRVYWVADANGGRFCARGGEKSKGEKSKGRHCESEQRGGACRPSDAELSDWRGEQSAGEAWSGGGGPRGVVESGGTSNPAFGGQRTDGGASGEAGHAEQLLQVGTGWPSDVQRKILEGLSGHEADGDQSGRDPTQPTGPVTASGGVGGTRDTEGDDQQRDRQSGPSLRRQEQVGGSVPWSDFIIHRYLDGKDRRIPVEPWLFPLADDRHPLHRGRVGILRLAGNAIVPYLAAQFISAWLECQLNGKET